MNQEEKNNQDNLNLFVDNYQETAEGINPEDLTKILDIKLNFALVFNTSIRNFQKIKRFLKEETDTLLIYQTRSTKKLWIRKEPEEQQ